MPLNQSLPQLIFSAAGVREIDRLAIEEYGIDGFELMQRAARFTFHCLCQRWPSTRHLVILCGAGNNAGDGYLVGAMAKRHGFDVDVYFVSDPTKLKGNARIAFEQCNTAGITPMPFSNDVGPLPSSSVVVDALLGTGINKPVSGLFHDAIAYCNAQDCPTMAVDVPSGLSANTGPAVGIAIEADVTATFIGLKIGLFTGRGRHYSGTLFFDDLDVPGDIISRVMPIVERLSHTELVKQLPPRQIDAHKGQAGHVLLIGGDRGYAGAIVMAAEAAARMGAGLISVATHAEHFAPLITRCPEVMVKPVSNSAELKALLPNADAIVVGPGLGQSAWSQHMLFTALHELKPTLLDADALNLICKHKEWLPDTRDHLIFTPHPGEAARMLESDVQAIQTDRLDSLRQLVETWGGTCLLKGSGSLIQSTLGGTRLSPYGNGGMASGGMGDVLSGMVGALLAQGLGPDFALDLAVCLHAKAADDIVAEYGARGLLATDLIPEARRLMNQPTSHLND